MRTIKLPTATFEYDPNKPLGRRGGFGQVFAGKTATGSEVAVKKLHLTAADAAHRELCIADELKGSVFNHVMPFIDAGQDSDTGEYFIVMPRAEGSLQDRIEKKGEFVDGEAVAVLLQIATGLIEVGKLVHRDLKPDNVLLHDGKWKIADFGIARFVEDSTSANTLRDCLSPLYAAPEQWQLKSTTHATDVYALGCIAYCLLRGKPPFLTNPAEEHQNASVPEFTCADPRLRSLVHMMLRKLPETRPVLSRVCSLLAQFIEKPQVVVGNSPHITLATAASVLAKAEQEKQARLEAQRLAEQARMQLAQQAVKLLSANIGRLWQTIQAQAPIAVRETSGLSNDFSCLIGRARLGVNVSGRTYIKAGEFPRSGWDVVASADIYVGQKEPTYVWSSNLWYMRISPSAEYRWHEVSYYSLRAERCEPHAETDFKSADLAASKTMHSLSIAFGPCLIDDEIEAEFHERWLWLLSKAVEGRLRHPSQIPFRWPPTLT